MSTERKGETYSDVEEAILEVDSGSGSVEGSASGTAESGDVSEVGLMGRGLTGTAPSPTFEPRISSSSSLLPVPAGRFTETQNVLAEKRN